MLDCFDVSVNKKDIQRGKRYDSLGCPIALAAQRVSPGFIVHATPAILILRDQHGDFYYELPEAARNFQHTFDNAQWDDLDAKLEPFTFPCSLLKFVPKKA